MKLFILIFQDLRTHFIHFDQLFRNITNIANGFSVLSGFAMSKVFADSENYLKFVSFGSRNIAAFDLDKSQQKLHIRKTWSFFSEKIKIIFESNDFVFFLNADSFLCVTNSKNQSQVQILSEIEYSQAIMLTKTHSSNSWYVFAVNNGILVLIEVGVSEVIMKWEIEKFTDVEIVSIRGKFIYFKSNGNNAVAFINESTNPPFLIQLFDSTYLTVDLMDSSEDMDILSIKSLGYSIGDSKHGFKVSELGEEGVLYTYNVNDSSLALAETDFGRYLCFSGKKLMYCSQLILIHDNFSGC